MLDVGQAKLSPEGDPGRVQAELTPGGDRGEHNSSYKLFAAKDVNFCTEFTGPAVFSFSLSKASLIR